jgi:hypothetical protein
MAPVTIHLPQLDFIAQSNVVLDIDKYLPQDPLGAYTNVNYDIKTDILNSMFGYVTTKASLGSITGIGTLGYSFAPPDVAAAPNVKRDFSGAMTSTSLAEVTGGYDAAATTGAQYYSPYVPASATASFAAAYSQFTAVFTLSGSATGQAIGSGVTVPNITTPISGISNLSHFSTTLNTAVDEALSLKLKNKMTLTPSLYDNTTSGASVTSDVSMEVMRALFGAGRDLTSPSLDKGVNITCGDGSLAIDIEGWLDTTTLADKDATLYTRYAGKLEPNDVITCMLTVKSNTQQLVPAANGQTGTISDRTYRLNFKAVV